MSEPKINLTDRRDVAKETNKVQTGSTIATSSHQAPFYHLIDPDTLRRLAERKQVGGKKYGWVQYRIGMVDPAYVADRINHLVEHIFKYLAERNDSDDNLGAILWGADFLCTMEREHPEVLDMVLRTASMTGEDALRYHKAQFLEGGWGVERKPNKDSLADCTAAQDQTR